VLPVSTCRSTGRGVATAVYTAELQPTAFTFSDVVVPCQPTLLVAKVVVLNQRSSQVYLAAPFMFVDLRLLKPTKRT